MTKISVALAAVLVLASAASSVSFAATSQAAMTQGRAVDECKAKFDPVANAHHTGDAVAACVTRLLGHQANQDSNAYRAYFNPQQNIVAQPQGADLGQANKQAGPYLTDHESSRE